MENESCNSYPLKGSSKEKWLSRKEAIGQHEGPHCPGHTPWGNPCSQMATLHIFVAQLLRTLVVVHRGPPSVDDEMAGRRKVENAG